MSTHSSILAWEIPGTGELFIWLYNGFRRIFWESSWPALLVLPLLSFLGSLPLGLALGSPIFPSACEGKLGVALESLQGLRDLT